MGRKLVLGIVCLLCVWTLVVASEGFDPAPESAIDVGGNVQQARNLVDGIAQASGYAEGEEHRDSGRDDPNSIHEWHQHKDDSELSSKAPLVHRRVKRGSPRHRYANRYSLRSRLMRIPLQTRYRGNRGRMW